MSSLKLVREAETLFSGTIIGSYLFVEAGLLQMEQINDIDLAINQINLGGAVNYFRDAGYVNPTGYHFHKEGSKTIQLVPHRDNFPIYTDLPQLVRVKFERSSESDLKQLLAVIKKKQNDK